MYLVSITSADFFPAKKFDGKIRPEKNPIFVILAEVFGARLL
jgi:hypothetical protein